MADCTLASLFEAVNINLIDPHVARMSVSGMQLDSRKINAGNVFVALAGAKAHGLAYAAQAIERGAVAILAQADETESEPDDWHIPASVPVIYVPQLRVCLGMMLNVLWDKPCQHMNLIGITGTNGKTSCCHLLTQALHVLGFKAASIGTLGYGMWGNLQEAERTTPDIVTIYAMLASLRDQGATHVVMEVSSHALDQQRVAGLPFKMAIFTNLTRDHLDYHHTIEAYAEAKAKLFAWPGLESAIINGDDVFGADLIARTSARLECLRASLMDMSFELVARHIHSTSHGLEFEFFNQTFKATVSSKLLGRFNAMNLILVAGALLSLGVTWQPLIEVLAQLEPVAGRMQKFGGGNRQLVVVDYSHTPDALEKALEAVREHCAGQLLCVFGCGGDRDAGKRPQMAAIAERLADKVIVTDDNPRDESGDAIVAAIMRGFNHPDNVTIERNRGLAIAKAIAIAGLDDAVLVAGKGHETYQEIKGHKYPFSDVDEVMHQLQEVALCT